MFPALPDYFRAQSAVLPTDGSAAAVPAPAGHPVHSDGSCLHSAAEYGCQGSAQAYCTVAGSDCTFPALPDYCQASAVPDDSVADLQQKDGPAAEAHSVHSDGMYLYFAESGYFRQQPDLPGSDPG